MIKVALNAEQSRILAKKLGLIFEGTGRKWALRNLRKGKTWEQLGSVSTKHLKAAEPAIKKHSPKGIEIAFRSYGKKRAPIQVGGMGYSPGMSFSKEIKKSFHTHPYEGLLKQKPDNIVRNVLKTQGIKGKKQLDEMVEIMREAGRTKELTTALASTKALSKVQRAHPDPTKLRLKGQMTDVASMEAMPMVHENILSPANKILGIHKLRRGGIREVYRQL